MRALPTVRFPLHAAIILAALLAAVGTAAAAAPTAHDDEHEVAEGGEATIPVLLNDADDATASQWLEFDGELVASDASGPFLLHAFGVDFYAYQKLSGLEGATTAVGTWTSLAGVAPGALTYAGGELDLVGVPGTEHVAYETWEWDSAASPFEFRVGGEVVGSGRVDVAVAVVDRNASSPTFATATGYGQITLTGPEGEPFFEEVRDATCGTGILYYDLDEFVPTRYSDPEVFLTTGRIEPVGYRVVSVEQALHGEVTVSPDGVTVTYRPNLKFDGQDRFTYTVEDCDGERATGNVTVIVRGENDAPDADFAWTPSPAVVGADVAFTDLSADPDGSVVAWRWDLGDGATSEAPAPTHAYAATGTYPVCLTVTDDRGASATRCRDVTVEPLPNQKPTAAWSHAPEAPLTLEDVRFTSLATDADGAIASWAWTFGDGATSAESDTTHAYADDGPYDVCLTVTDDDGASDTACRAITVLNRAPVAAFDLAPLPTTNLDDVLFADASDDLDGSVVEWRWDFGDGAASVEQSPVHRYARGGTYLVTLTVTDDDGATGTATRVLDVLPVIMVGRAVGLDGSAVPAPQGDTGRLRTEEAAAAHASAHDLEAAAGRVTGARAEVAAVLGEVEARVSVGIARVDLGPAGVLVLEGLEATAHAACHASPASRVVIARATLNGLPLLEGVEPAPNTVVDVPGVLRLVLHERAGGAFDVAVAGVRVVLPDGSDVVVGSAEAAVENCPRAVRPDASDGAAPEAEAPARAVAALGRRLDALA